MKKAILSIVIALLLGACNLTPHHEARENDDAIAANTNHPILISDDEMINKLEGLKIAEFELEVEYGGKQEYEAEIDQKHDGSYEVTIKNELNGESLSGQKAFHDLFPRLQQLHLHDKSADDDVLQQILDAFDLPTDYKSFELEMTFSDGKKLKVKNKN